MDGAAWPARPPVISCPDERGVTATAIGIATAAMTIAAASPITERMWPRGGDGVPGRLGDATLTLT